MTKAILLVVFAILNLAFAKVITPSDDYLAEIRALTAGQTLTLSAGTYSYSGKTSFTLNGTPEQPIIVEGALGEAVIVTRPDTNQNLWDFQGSNFIIRNIEFVGGSRGLRLGENGNVENAVFENLVVHDTETTAFSMNSVGKTYNNITIRNVEIYNTGADTSECFYLGCNYNECQFTNSLVEYVFCHDTLNALDDYGAGIQIKTGSYNNIIRNSVFWDTHGVGILIYDDYDMGVNTVEGNLVVNAGDHGIQFTAGAVVRNNIVFNSVLAGIGGIVNQPMSGASPRNIIVTQNTVVSSSDDGCLRGNSWGASTIEVSNNAFFCEGKPVFKIGNDQSAATWSNNGIIGDNYATGIPNGGVFDIGSVDTETQDPANYNYYPKSTSKLIGAGTANKAKSDFNCSPRPTDAPTVGAYQYVRATNPGWIPTKSMKPYCGANPSSTTASTTDYATAYATGFATGYATGYATGTSSSSGCPTGNVPVGDNGSSTESTTATTASSSATSVCVSVVSVVLAMICLLF